MGTLAQKIIVKRVHLFVVVIVDEYCVSNIFSPRIIFIDCVLDIFFEYNEWNGKIIVYATRNTKIIRLKLRNAERSFLIQLRLVKPYHVNNIATRTDKLENIKSSVSLNSFQWDMWEPIVQSATNSFLNHFSVRMLRLKDRCFQCYPVQIELTNFLI